MNRNCEHESWEWGTGEKVNVVCARKVGEPKVHTHYLLASNLSPRNTTLCTHKQLLLQPHGQFDHDEILFL